MAARREWRKYFPVAAGGRRGNLVRHKRPAWRHNPFSRTEKPSWLP